MTEEDSKYLAEKMGIDHWYFINALKWKQFGTAFEWAKKQEFFRLFLSWFIEGKKDQFSGKEWWDKGNHYFEMPIELIGPRFAEELVEFLGIVESEEEIRADYEHRY